MQRSNRRGSGSRFHVEIFVQAHTYRGRHTEQPEDGLPVRTVRARTECRTPDGCRESPPANNSSVRSCPSCSGPAQMDACVTGATLPRMPRTAGRRAVRPIWPGVRRPLPGNGLSRLPIRRRVSTHTSRHNRAHRRLTGATKSASEKIDRLRKVLSVAQLRQAVKLPGACRIFIQHDIVAVPPGRIECHYPAGMQHPAFRYFIEQLPCVVRTLPALNEPPSRDRPANRDNGPADRPIRSNNSS